MSPCAPDILAPGAAMPDEQALLAVLREYPAAMIVEGI